MGRACWRAVPRPSRDVRKLKFNLQALPAVGAKGRIRRAFQGLIRRPRFRIRYRRRPYCSGPPAWSRRKRGIQNQAIGRSRGSLTAKIVALVDALGNLVRFLLLPGQWHDSVGIEPLIEDIEFDAPFGDKAFDNDWLSGELDQRGARPSSRRKDTALARFLAALKCTNGVICKSFNLI